MTEKRQKDREKMNRIYERELELIKHGKDLETANPFDVFLRTRSYLF